MSDNQNSSSPTSDGMDVDPKLSFIDTNVDSSSSDMDMTPSSTSSSPKSSTSSSPKSPLKPFLPGPNNIIENIQNINKRLVSTKTKLVKTYEDYKDVMKIYNDGYDISIQLATRLAKELYALNQSSALIQTKLNEKAKQLEALELEKRQLDSQKQAFEKEKIDLTTKMADVESQLNKLNRENLEKADRLLKLNQQLEEAQRNAGTKTTQALNIQNANSNLLTQVNKLNAERDEINKLLQKTSEQVFALNQAIEAKTREYMTAVEGNKRKRVNVLGEYKLEADKLHDIKARSAELQQIYQNLIKNDNLINTYLSQQGKVPNK